MEWIGFIVSAFILGCVSLTWVGSVWMWCGEYNIGGVPNTWKQRTSVAVAGLLLFWLWMMLYENAPEILR